MENTPILKYAIERGGVRRKEKGRLYYHPRNMKSGKKPMERSLPGTEA